MADRRVKVVFSAEIQGFKRAMEEAAQATKKTQTASEQSSKAADTYLGKLAQSANKNREEWELAGGQMLKFGAASVAGLGLAGKAAVDWETAWAGVTKTVDGTPAQMDELEESLRGLAKTLPATHEEIAGVAEAAGQLGVAREDVTGFTKTMVDLGETTNLSADEAATAIAQISNVMGTMERDGSEGVERFGATLVALGNAGASTEAEIVDMAKRIAGAGKLVGASESDVLALANAMASVGIEAQLGGGVISRVMQRMYGDVKEGGEGLDNLAKVAGVSSKDFAAAFETDPVRAVDMMVKGLGRVKAEGGNVIDTMSDLGIKGTEETSVLLRLAGAGDLLSDSLKLGDEAWQSNSALAEEAAKRYETTESKVKIAWNNIKDAAIDAGAVLLPVIAGVAESVASIAQAFGSLPAPVQGALTILGGVAGVAALGAGAFLTLTPKVLDAMQAFDKLAPAGGRARGALEKVGKAAGVAAGLAAVTTVLAKMAEADYMSKIDVGMGKVALALADVTSAGPGAATALDGLFKDREGGDLINTVTDLESAIGRTFNKDAGQSFNDWGESLVHGMTGVKGSSQILGEQFERLDAGLSDLVAGGKTDDAAEAFEKIKAAAEAQDVSVEELTAKFPQYADALKQAEADAKGAGEGGDAAAAGIKAVGDASDVAAAQVEEIETALEDVGVATDGTITDLDKFTEALQRAGLLNLSARDAARGFQDAIDGVGESLKTNGRTLDIDTEKGRANEAALDAVAAAGMKVVEANAANGEGQKVLQGNLSDTYDALVDSARAFTDTDEEAQALARDILKVPKGVNVDTWMDSEAKRMADDTKTAIDKIPKKVTVTIDTYRTTFEKLVGLPTTSVGDGSYGKGQGVYAPGFIPKKSILPKKAEGGRLPSSGPGTGTTDGILGISSAGVPTAHVDAGEWIVNRNSSGRYDRELAAINAGTFPKLPGFATGGMFSARSLGYSPASAAPSSGVSVDLSGATYQALDPGTLRQEILSDIKWELQKQGVRLGG